MKKNLMVIAIMMSSLVFAQTGNVGINTVTPATTLDVVGQPQTAAILDGVIAPRLNGDQLNAKSYTTAQKGALVYVNASASSDKQIGQTINVNSPGYYYFDGNIWQQISSGANYKEPWNSIATGLPAISNLENIYQTGSVSIGQRATRGMLNVYKTDAGTTNNISLAHFEYKGGTLTQTFDLYQNIASGSFTSLSRAGDMGLIFSVDNNGSVYTNNGVVLAPHVSSGGATSYGLKITEQGFTGINVQNPTENFDVAGTVRVRTLPLSGTASIYTAAGGGSSIPATTTAIPAPTQMFTGNRTVIADANGVLGSVNGLPGSYNAIATKSGTLTAADYTVLATGNIQLPAASLLAGKIYIIVYNGTSAEISSSVRSNGVALSNYTLNGTAGQSGVTLQSDGSNWYVISKY